MKLLAVLPIQQQQIYCCQYWRKWYIMLNPIMETDFLNSFLLFWQALNIGVNPLFLMIPATVTCSYAFMLPVATPPNAIVFSATGMNPVEMVRIDL